MARRSGPHLATAAAMCMMLAACSSSTHPAARQTTTTVRVGDEVGVTSTTSPVAAPGTRPGAGSVPPAAAVHVKVTTDRGVVLPGIRVLLTGGTGAAATSGPDGVATFAVPVGHYQARVDAGCAGALFIQHVGTADVPPGLDVRGTLTVPAVRRVAVHGRSSYRRISPPLSPGEAGTDASWHVGQVYAVSFATTDRCTNAPAAGQSFSTTVFTAGRSYRLVGSTSGTTGSDGRGQVQLTCTASTDDVPSLVAAAAIDDRDRVDLLSFDTLDRSEPTCQP